jgi:polar amino acid transport system substrate-binding protein
MKSLIFTLIALCFTSLAHSTTYSVSAYAWEPFIGPSRSDGGISIKLLREIMLSQGHNIDVKPMSWSKALVVAEKGDIDILPAVWFTEERKKTMLYSEPYAYNRIVFVKHKADSYEYQGIDSLNGKVIGIIKEYAYNEELLANKEVRFSKSDSLLNNMKKVAAQRIDLTLDDEIVVKAMTPPDILNQVTFTKDALSEKPLYITCYKSNSSCKGIITSFNKGLKEMQANGALKKLLDQLGI